MSKTKQKTQNDIENHRNATSSKIADKCAEMAAFLQEKNESYGDSALHPLHIFATGDAAEGLKWRIHDKLARIEHLTKSGKDAASDESLADSIKDLTGYLILLMIDNDERKKTK